MIAVFLAPLDLPWSRPVLAVPVPRSQDMRIKYMFILQRYVYRATVRPDAGRCRRRRRHPLLALEIRELLWAANITIASSLLGFAPIQCIKREQDPAGLTPQRRFIAAEAIECEIRQISQTQKAAGELDGIVSFHVTVRVSSSKQGMNNVSRIR